MERTDDIITSHKTCIRIVEMIQVTDKKIATYQNSIAELFPEMKDLRLKLNKRIAIHKAVRARLWQRYQLVNSRIERL